MGGIEAAAPPAASVDTRLNRIESFTQETVRVILRNSPGCSWVDSSGGYARVDGLLVNNRGELLALYEIKCRNVSVTDLFGKFDAELMVDAGKLNSMQSISRMMCARSYLVSYLTPAGVVLQTQITNDSGELVCPTPGAPRDHGSFPKARPAQLEGRRIYRRESAWAGERKKD